MTKLLLSTKERAVLARLALASPATASRESLAGAARGKGAKPKSDRVSPIVCALRKKLAALGFVIETKRGAGYRLPEAFKAKALALACRAGGLPAATDAPIGARSGPAPSLTQILAPHVADLMRRLRPTKGLRDYLRFIGRFGGPHPSGRPRVAGPEPLDLGRRADGSFGL
jgi:hypothetical protein